MKSFYYIIIFLLLSSTVLYGQNTTYPTLKKEGKNTEAFVPSGWRILAATYGDLNKDKLQDAVLVLQCNDPKYIVKRGEAEYDTNLRMLVILFKNADGGYRLADYSETFILRNNSPAERIDPFQAITINNGVLSVDFQFYYVDKNKDVANATYKFRHNGKSNAFDLIGAEIFEISPVTGVSENYSYNFMTRKMCRLTSNVRKNTSPREVCKTIPADMLKTLKTHEQPYTCEFEKNIRF